MTTAIVQLVTGGIVYLAHDRVEDNVMIRGLSKMLMHLPQESIFDALYFVSHHWRQQDDVLSFPSHDPRHNVVDTYWIFDLDKDILRFEKKFQTSYVALSDFCQRPITITDFKPYRPVRALECTMQLYFRPPFRRRDSIKEDPEPRQRRKSFIPRLLADFAYQWRHILHSPCYNEYTFRRLAFAIIRLAGLDFTVVENDLPRQSKGEDRVSIHDLPTWDPSSKQVFSVENRRVIICRHMGHAVYTVGEDFADRYSEADKTTDRVTYIIISMTGIVRYKISNYGTELYSKPEPLFDGTNTPTPEAIEVLAAIFPKPARSRLHKLPIEVQDLILDYVSAGPIERGRISCLLEIGATHSWKRRDGLEIQRQERHTHRHPETPVESEIWFDNDFSGLAYE